MPNTPPFVLGVANVRGAIVPALDLCNLLGLPESNAPQADRRLVQLKGRTAGLLAGVVVDALHGIQRFQDGEEPESQPRVLDVDALFGSSQVRGLMGEASPGG